MSLPKPNKNCPYCGRKYELKKKDWVLTGLKRR